MISFKGSSDLAHFTCRIVSEAKTTSLAIHQNTSKSISLSEMFKILFILGCFMFGGVKSPQKPWGRWMNFVINVCTNYEWKKKGTWILKRVLEHFMKCFPENHLANRFKCESQNVVFYIVMPTSGSSVLSGILWSWKCSSRICPVNQTCCNSICKFLQIFTIKSKCQKASVFVFTVYVCWSF